MKHKSLTDALPRPADIPAEPIQLSQAELMEIFRALPTSRKLEAIYSLLLDIEDR